MVVCQIKGYTVVTKNVKQAWVKPNLVDLGEIKHFVKESGANLNIDNYFYSGERKFASFGVEPTPPGS